MSVYLITWDLNKERSNYNQARQEFISNLEDFENIKDSGLDSVRFISTDWDINKISDDLRSKMDKNDNLFIVEIKRGNHQGWMSENTWNWINERL